jgi:hypothetical protein
MRSCLEILPKSALFAAGVLVVGLAGCQRAPTEIRTVTGPEPVFGQERAALEDPYEEFWEESDDRSAWPEESEGGGEDWEAAGPAGDPEEEAGGGSYPGVDLKIHPDDGVDPCAAALANVGALEERRLHVISARRQACQTDPAGTSCDSLIQIALSGDVALDWARTRRDVCLARQAR